MSKELVKIVKGFQDLDTLIADDDFLRIVNQEPPASLIKEHPMAKGVKYMPIDKVEMMLTKMFQHWHVEILREGQMLNSVYVTVRLHYKHPLLDSWTFQDGVGAMTIQVDKGQNASNMGAIKSNAIMLGLPAAKSYAIKDAAENIGKVFGRDLNRKDTMAFTPSYGTDKTKASLAREKLKLRKKLEISSE